MKVTVATLLGMRRLLGWSQKELDFSGGTVGDLLSAIEVPQGGTVKNLLLNGDGTFNSRYRFALNQQIIDSVTMNTEVKEGDRLVLMDALHVPSLTC